MAQRKTKTTSQTSASKSKSDSVKASASQPFFPLARYTSIVGVHSSLLAFAGLFLPRTTFAPLSKPGTRSQVPRSAIIILTEKPARTVAWICLGALIMQGWWATYLREWELDVRDNRRPLEEGEVETDERRTERKLRQQEWNSQQGVALFQAVIATIVGSAVFHVVAVLFGAGITTHIRETYFLSLLVSLLVVFPPAFTIGIPTLKSDSKALVTRLTWVRLFAELSPRSPLERALVYPAIGTLVGCWLGAIPIGLDWDRPWQAYPLTPAYGALAGYIVASLWAVVVNNLKYLIYLGETAAQEDTIATEKAGKARVK